MEGTAMIAGACLCTSGRTLVIFVSMVLGVKKSSVFRVAESVPVAVDEDEDSCSATVLVTVGPVAWGTSWSEASAEIVVDGVIEAAEAGRAFKLMVDAAGSGALE
ncbi:hypothetical protein M378DRAFT_539870 [Amanita muscaria Koide BX008]|uniref:Uncharacterized protein n=1 Tax=Amanita muscaria (strain Koide BX008) TaxID=946122 RepID=A0A0C2S0K2_AMAMK|nr:hypothetical protein M378DRAFT_539870 [Amanita muscaria Koide BX008]